MKLRLIKTEVLDDVVRENFRRIEEESDQNILNKGRFKFVEIVVTGSVTEAGYLHRLTFIPKDVIVLSVADTDTTTVTWHPSLYDREKVYITTDGPCTIRAFVGRYEA